MALPLTKRSGKKPLKGMNQMPIFDIDEIKELLNAFDSSKATELEVRGMDGERLIFKQTTAAPVIVANEQPIIAQPTAVTTTIPQAVSNDTSSTCIKEEPVQEGTPIPSPMVGVFYAASSPDAEPYVKVGSKVHKGDVLCLIEAMKLMNEVTAEKDGEIVSICAENGQVVEYGQALFMVK